MADPLLFLWSLKVSIHSLNMKLKEVWRSLFRHQRSTRLNATTSRGEAIRPAVNRQEWISRELFQLANIAWAPRRKPASTAFVFHSDSAHFGLAQSAMEKAIFGFYLHASEWAPGLSVPASPPIVKMSPLLDSAGQYTVTNGRVTILVGNEFFLSPDSSLAILAHEACHHIRDLSGLRVADRGREEILTDLTMYICGFGDMFQRGSTRLRETHGRWSAMHLGYLDSAQQEYAQEWV